MGRRTPLPWWRSRLPHKGLGDRRGFLLPLVLVVLIVGSLTITPLLALVAGGMRGVGRTAERERAYYAAEGGLEAAMADLVRGKDPLDPSYSPPSLTLNGHTVSITVEEVAQGPPAPPVLVDPVSGTGLSDPLGPGGQVLFPLADVLPSTPLVVNWAFVGEEARLALYKGEGTAGPPVAQAQGGGPRLRLTVDPGLIEGGRYTLLFANTSGGELTSAPFSPSGEADGTWVQVTAYREFRLTARAGPVEVSALVRRWPGPSPTRFALEVLAWEVR